jgi:hypothetical protein
MSRMGAGSSRALTGMRGLGDAEAREGVHALCNKMSRQGVVVARNINVHDSRPADRVCEACLASNESALLAPMID